METMKIAGVEYPVLGTVTVKGQPIPLLNIRMMSDERELARGGNAMSSRAYLMAQVSGMLQQANTRQLELVLIVLRGLMDGEEVTEHG